MKYHLTQKEIEEALEQLKGFLPEDTQLTGADIAEMYERAMDAGLMTHKQMKQFNKPSGGLGQLASVLKAAKQPMKKGAPETEADLEEPIPDVVKQAAEYANMSPVQLWDMMRTKSVGIQGGVPDGSETRAKRHARMSTPLRDAVKGKLLAITNPKTIASTVKSWSNEEQAEAMKLLSDPEFLQEYAGIKLKSQDGGAELISQMLFSRTKQLNNIQDHMADNRAYAMYHMFTSPSSLPDDEAIQARFKDMEGQAVAQRNGLYDMFTSDRLNMRTRSQGLQIRTKEALTRSDNIEFAYQARQDAAVRQFYAQQAQIQTPEQRRMAAVDWRTHRL